MTMTEKNNRNYDFLRLAESVYCAGYNGADKIEFEVCDIDFFKQNRKELEAFVDYLLNEPGCSKKKFSVKLNPIFYKTSELQTEIDFTANHDLLAFSGGIDSLTAFFKMDNPKCFFVNYEQPQLFSEFFAMDWYARQYRIDYTVYTAPKKPDIVRKSAWKLNGFKIPARNFLITSLLATQIQSVNSRLGLGVYKGEILDKNRDKSQYFFDYLTEIYTKFYQVPVLVYSPIADMKKSDEINFLYDLGIDITKSRTCVSGSVKPCGHCKPCFNLWISLKNSKHPELIDPQWEKKILKSGYIDIYRKNIEQYDKERQEEILNAISSI